jgi:hypothetical protein
MAQTYVFSYTDTAKFDLVNQYKKTAYSRISVKSCLHA